MDILITIAAWYGVACVAFNGLSVLTSAIVKQTPGTSDDEALDRFYASPIYRAFSWFFSWGDYIGEFIAKLKTR